MPSYNPREDEPYFRYGHSKDEGSYYYNPHPSREFRRYGPMNILLHVMMGILFFLLAAAVFSLIALLAETAEEFPSTARKVMWLLIAINVAAHVAIMLFDQPSLLCSVASLIANGLYARLMKTFPFVPALTHPVILATGAWTAVESVLWIVTIRSHVLNEGVSTLEAVTLVLFLWLAPLGFLCAAVPDSEQLPGARAGGAANSWSGARVASPRFVTPGSGGVHLGESDEGRQRPSASPPHSPLGTASRNQTVFGRLVRFLKNPGET